jgi:hypothetical protein
LTKSITFQSSTKIGKTSSKFNTNLPFHQNYNTNANTKSVLEINIKLNNGKKIKSSNLNQSIKTPKAFPVTKNINILKKCSTAYNAYNTNCNYSNAIILKEFTEDSEKTISYKNSDTLENNIHITQFDIRSNKSNHNEDEKENEINLKMLESAESEDSFVIDFDMSNEEDLVHMDFPKRKKINKLEKRLKNKSVVEKIITSEVNSN